jgi:hypothetical protein
MNVAASRNPSSKIFCVGASKTGTTSLEAFFKQLGFSVGNQAAGELLIRSWALRDFEPILTLALSAQVFQDIPFSLPFTFSALDSAYPGAQFILSVRDDPDQWYNSFIRFYIKLIGKGRLPTATDLKEFTYRYKGWIFEVLQLIYGISEHDPFERLPLTRTYELHNETVRYYFEHRPQSLLTINISDPCAAKKIMTFIGLPFRGEIMPHLNRSDT